MLRAFPCSIPHPVPSLTVSLSPQSLSPQERAAYKEHISNVSIHVALLWWHPGALGVGWGCQGTGLETLGVWDWAGSVLGEVWMCHTPESPSGGGLSPRQLSSGIFSGLDTGKELKWSPEGFCFVPTETQEHREDPGPQPQDEANDAVQVGESRQPHGAPSPGSVLGAPPPRV